MSVDLLELAPHARWRAGELTDDHSMDTPRAIRFNGPDHAGARVVSGLFPLEDGSLRDALVTAPPAGRRATIRGWLPRARMPEHAVFEATLGSLAGSPSAASMVQVWAYELTPDGVRSALVVRARKTVTGGLERLRGDLSFLAGRDVAIELRIDVADDDGVPSAVAWVHAAVVCAPPPPTLESLARAWSASPTTRGSRTHAT